MGGVVACGSTVAFDILVRFSLHSPHLTRPLSPFPYIALSVVNFSAVLKREREKRD